MNANETAIQMKGKDHNSAFNNEEKTNCIVSYKRPQHDQL